MSDSRDYTGLNPDDIVEGLKVSIESEGPALKVRGIGNGNEGGSPSPGGTTNYNDLMNKPKINGVILSGDKSWKDLGLDIDNLGGGCEFPPVEIPEKLPNPEALTIEIDGKETTYDGSEAKKVVIPKVEVPDIPDTPEIPTKLPNPHKLIVTQSEQQNIEYDGSAEQYVHLPSASVIASQDVLLSDALFAGNGNEVYTLNEPITNYDWLVFTYCHNVPEVGANRALTTKWFKVQDIEFADDLSGAGYQVLDINWSTTAGAYEAFVFTDATHIKHCDTNGDQYGIYNIDILGLKFVEPPMNPFPLVITQGDQVHEYTGHETVNVTIPDTSKGIKNPNALTIKEEGKDDIIYDGSVAKEITIPKQSSDVDIPEKLPNPYALKMHNPDGTETAYDGSVEVQLDINSSALLANRTLLLDSIDIAQNEEHTLLRDITDFDYIIVTGGIQFATQDFTEAYETKIIDVSTIPISQPDEDVLIHSIHDGGTWVIAVFAQFLSNTKLKITFLNVTGTNATVRDLKIYGINFKEAIGNDTPVGTILSYMGTKAPKNYLTCDGSAYNISDYPELSNHMKVEFGSINFFGGDGVSTFAVPDLRGEFLRGAGEAARATGSGADVGIHQDGSELPNYGSQINKIYASNITDNDRCVHADKDIMNESVKGNFVSANPVDLIYKVSHFTTRPTNTSVMFCIKCRETYTGGSVNYSTEEHVVGKWIDGRTLYERTIVFDMNRPGLAATDSVLLIDLPDEYDFIFIHSGNVEFKNSTHHFTYSLNTYAQLAESILVYTVDNSIHYIENMSSQYTILKYYVTIRYTKK